MQKKNEDNRSVSCLHSINPYYMLLASHLLHVRNSESVGLKVPVCPAVTKLRPVSTLNPFILSCHSVMDEYGKICFRICTKN